MAPDLLAMIQSMQLIGVDRGLALSAGELAAQMALRGYDAVHLATALSVEDDLVLATWDRELARAATRAGRAVVPPLAAG